SRSQNKVEQSPRLLTVKAGEDSTFKCSYKITPFNNLQWFKQSPGKGLVFLTFTRFSDETKSNGRFKATINATSEEGYLRVTSSQSKDSATYFCVAS
uniref:Ig-like domain-containing protein n=1 Tax=Sarcophilus harrisii TaxID=9305 RepID=A0A7N4P0G0_SARHA